MRSIWLWFLLVPPISLGTADANDWKTNTDVMDLAIGIRYMSQKTEKPVRLITVINALVNEFQLSQTKTRVAVTEFFINSRMERLLLFEDSIDAGKMAKKLQAIEKTDRLNISKTDRYPLRDVADSTRAMNDPSHERDRMNVPMVVVVISEVHQSFLNNPRLKQRLLDDARKAMDDGGSVVFLSEFKADNTPDKADVMIVFPTIGKEIELDHLPSTATKVASAIRDSLKQCVYKETMGACYFNTNKKCLADVKYKTANSNSPETPPSKDPEWYCFKDGTIPCPTGDEGCMSTMAVITSNRPITDRSTNTSLEDDDEDDDDLDDPNVYYPDDPFIVNLKILLIVEGVLVAIITPMAIYALIWAIRMGREANQEVKRFQTASSFLRGQYKGWKDTSGPPQWSVTKPPSLSITPVDELIKFYSKKEKQDVQEVKMATMEKKSVKTDAPKETTTTKIDAKLVKTKDGIGISELKATKTSKGDMESAKNELKAMKEVKPAKKEGAKTIITEMKSSAVGPKISKTAIKTTKQEWKSTKKDVTLMKTTEKSFTKYGKTGNTGELLLKLSKKPAGDQTLVKKERSMLKKAGKSTTSRRRKKQKSQKSRKASKRLRKEPMKSKK